MPDSHSDSKPMVVGIGASAGGLKALKQLFERLAGDTGLVYVVVVHLSPEHPSHLADLLQPSCKMPVIQVTETVPMEANRVYVIPPGRNLSSIDTHLRLSDLEEARRERAPIDHFFDTLSRTHHEQAIGIILSGTGSDGTLGIKKIKEGGGLTIVQEPNEADFDGMPQSAIATRLVDLILPVEEMPGYLQRFAETRPRVGTSSDLDELSETDRQILQHIFAQLRARTGQDFSTYKRSTVVRRLRRRMQLQQKVDLESYLALLRQNPTEVRLLAEDFLITVTQFFRDRETFDYLERHIIPNLFKDKAPGDRVRVWSVGCATGEEAYSVAMLLLEEASRRIEPLEVQVFASDLHEHSLQRAREGLYPETISADVPEERMARFFTKEDGSYRIRKDVREVVVFANHNLLNDPPFSHMDMIVCRNLLIYLQREPQHDVLDLFHYALNPDGVLVLGSSETVNRAGLFRVENKHHSVYRRRNVPRPEPRLPVFFQPMRRESYAGAAHARRPGTPLSYGDLHYKAVERYAPPSLLVNEENHVVYLSDHAGRYLQVSGGDLSAGVYKLAREELRLELRAALQYASETGKPIRTKAVQISLDGQPKRVVMYVRPCQAEDLEGFHLVLFEEMEEAKDDEPYEQTARPSSEDQRAELERVRDQLQSVVEQYESSQEEMKAANEELQSTNEELRSAMEELETSKEELQSMNEELQTVNQENRHKVEELSQLTGDLNNLIAATEIATLFLDQKLRILRVTPRVAELFNVRSSDRGRPLADFTNRVGYGDLAADAQRVLERLVPIEREVQSGDPDHKWYLMRMLPYRTADRIKGVVITFFEITGRKQTELALRESEESFRALITASAQIVWRTDVSGLVVEDSPSWRAFTGQTFAQFKGAGWLDALHPEDRERTVEAWRQSVERNNAIDEEFRLMHVSGEWRWTHMRAVPLAGGQNNARGLIAMIFDITDRKHSEQALREADERKDQFLAMLGHELRNPLAPLRTVSDLLQNASFDAPQLQDVRHILRRQVQRLSRLVDDLLDVSRIKSGRIKLQLQRLDLREVVEDAVGSAETGFREGEQRLASDQWPESLTVEGDPIRLEQVVANLLDNAAKYTPNGGRIDVATRRSGEWAEISVRDDGIGIAPDMLGRVFDLFCQGPADAKSAASGLGLGLTLVRQLAELHGGSVEARSEGLGQGSEFIVRLPLLSERRAALRTPQDAVGSAQTDGEAIDSHSNGRRILLVGDNRDAANVLALVLRQAGHQVHVAYDGRSALERANAFLPEVAVLDIRLPDMNGYDLAAELRRAGASAPRLIIALSGYYGEDSERARSGIDHHLVKPVDSSELLRLVAA